MPESQTVEQVPLEAKSPFVLRAHLSRSVTDADARAALESGDMGFLHSFTTGSTVDGPGVRVVAWTTGCMFHCLYCHHNPDTWDMKNGMPITIETATEELRKYRFGLKIMSGGFTISGGEPMLQHRFVLKLFRAAQGMGLHTALDTNGHFGTRLTDQELEAINLVLLDIKTWDPERHRHLTGMEVEPTLAFARRLADRKRPVWLRFVLVPGLTDDPDDIAQIADFAAGLGNVASRRSSLPSNGALQVERTRHELHATQCRTTDDGTGRAHLRAVPIRGPQRSLKSPHRTGW
jgi:pyruvate formate lyase activating enzyme